MAQINPRSFADALLLGDQIYELILTNWGNRGAKQDPNNGSIQYPPIPSLPNGAIPIVPAAGISNFTMPLIPSLSAIAISPRSDVDRCILNFPVMPQASTAVTQIPPNNLSSNSNPTIDQGFVNLGGILETEHVLSIGCPVIGQVTGPIIVRAHPSTWFDDSFIEAQTIPETGVGFGTAINTGVISGTTFTKPELRLLLYFNSRNSLPTGRRTPFHRSWTSSLGTTPRYFAFPAMGRRTAKISVRNLGSQAFPAPVGPQTLTAQITGTITTIEGTILTVGPAQDNTAMYEIELVAPVAIDEQDSADIAVCDLGVNFIIVRLSCDPAQVPFSYAVSVDLFD